MRIFASAMLFSVIASGAATFAHHSHAREGDTLAGAATGSICLGTDEECAAGIRTSERVGYDMLIRFDLNSAELTSDARATLAQFARALREKRLRTYNFVIEGHTDAHGSITYNAELSRRRADTVAAFLLENGVEPERISTVGMGTRSPRIEDPFDAGNRRVQVRIAP